MPVAIRHPPLYRSAGPAGLVPAAWRCVDADCEAKAWTELRAARKERRWA